MKKRNCGVFEKMNLSLSGYLKFDSNAYLYKEKNLPIPVECVDAKIGDEYTISLKVIVTDTEMDGGSHIIDGINFLPLEIIDAKKCE